MKKIIFVVLLLLPQVLFASFYLEPYLGFATGKLTEDFSHINGSNSTATTKGNTGGADFGLRIYKKFFNQFMLGGDATLGINGVSMDVAGSPSTTQKYSLVSGSYGAIIGWDIPTILFPRIWGGFYLDSLSMVQSNSSSDSDTFSGTSFKYGVSFDWWIQVGIEHAIHTYKSINGHKLPYTTTVAGINMTSEKLKFDEYILTFSWPIELGK